MIKTTAMIHEALHEYRAPANKLSRMVDQEELFPIVRGLYETNQNTPGYLLASSIYGPSYLSFDFALSYYHLIPEAVYAFTSATYDKKKKKQFKTDFGTFMFQDVPKEVYPIGIRIVEEQGYAYLIAEPEKALCDKIYTISPLSSQKEIDNLLFHDLRIDVEEYEKLDKKKLEQYARLYCTTNHKLLVKMLRRRK